MGVLTQEVGEGAERRACAPEAKPDHVPALHNWYA